MSKGVWEWLRAADDALAVLREQRRRFDEAYSEHRALERRFDDALPDQLESVLDGLLPEGVLNASCVDAAAKQIGCQELVGFDPFGAITAKKGELQRELDELEQGEVWPLIDKELAQLEAALEEQQEALRPSKRFVRRATHERLETLLDNGYGTEAYDVAWWRMSYYSDWKAGDEILEGYPDHEEWGPWLEEYRYHVNEVARLEAEVEQLDERVALMRRVQRDHFELSQRLLGVEAEVGHYVRDTLKASLARSGPSAFSGLAAGAEHELAAKRWAGIGKQLQYLQELRENQLEPFGEGIARQIAKLERKSIKYRRPKKAHTRFSEDEFQRTFKDRRPKYAKFWKSYERSFAAIRDFERYEYGSFEDRFLWWDLMGEGRVRNRFSPEVEEFYEEYPDYTWETPWEDDYDDESYAAAAVVEADGYEQELWDGS
ncbi:MAG TPA: hypothetical protein DEA08_23395 [Planctomycetes bacterium]|nr:hypothetical protein [Planctomycetota bacterium]